MSSEPEGIYAEYFQHTREAQLKYGPKSVVLMQVGAFFEMYGLKRSDCPEIAGSCVAAVATACGGLAISEKKSFFGPAGAQIVMAGFRDYTLD